MTYYRAVEISQSVDNDVVAATLREMDVLQTFASPVKYSENGTNLYYVEKAIQNLEGMGKIITESTVLYPAPWPWTVKGNTI